MIFVSCVSLAKYYFSLEESSHPLRSKVPSSRRCLHFNICIVQEIRIIFIASVKVIFNIYADLFSRVLLLIALNNSLKMSVYTNEHQCY